MYLVFPDKLLINNGDIIAEYIALQPSNIIKGNLLNENGFEENKKNRLPNLRDKYSFDFSDNSLNSDDQSDINAAELRIQQEIDEEKCLINEIINRLSSSLKCNPKNEKVHKHYGQSKENQYDTSPTSSLNTDDSMACMIDKFSMKNRMRKHVITPRYRRKIFGQNNNKVPLIPVYNPNDSIISKSPNFLIGKPIETEQRYLSPKISNRESKFKSLTPCMTRNGAFRSEEFNLGTEMARSTPRRKKRVYKQYSSFRKFRKSNDLTSSENTSPDSTNSLSPDSNFLRKMDYKNLAIKLHENKYDDDTPINTNLNENKDHIERFDRTRNKTKILMERLNNNMENLEIRTNRMVKQEEDFKQNSTLQEKVAEESKNNNILNTFKENFNTLFSR